MKVENWKCPDCGNLFTGHTELSRKDNKTQICSSCCTHEAFNGCLNDEVERRRMNRLTEINISPNERKELELLYGRVWDTKELSEDFKIEGFLAPFVIVIRKADNVKGSLEFQHDPRYYFNFSEV